MAQSEKISEAGVELRTLYGRLHFFKKLYNADDHEEADLMLVKLVNVWLELTLESIMKILKTLEDYQARESRP